jgi:hypothetical protein
MSGVFGGAGAKTLTSFDPARTWRNCCWAAGAGGRTTALTANVGPAVAAYVFNSAADIRFGLLAELPGGSE